MSLKQSVGRCLLVLLAALSLGGCPSDNPGDPPSVLDFARFSIGGTIQCQPVESGTCTGLAGTVVLTNNVVPDIFNPPSGIAESFLDVLTITDTIEGGASFTFNKALRTRHIYAVSVRTQPNGQTCTVSGGDTGIGSGTVVRVNIDTIVVTCTPNAESPATPSPRTLPTAAPTS